MVGDVDREECRARGRAYWLFIFAAILLFSQYSNACIVKMKLSSMDVTWYACLKTEAEGSVVFLTELSLLGFAFFCVSGLRFLPNVTLRAEGICLSHSSGDSMNRFLPFSIRYVHVIIICYCDLRRL